MVRITFCLSVSNTLGLYSPKDITSLSSNILSNLCVISFLDINEVILYHSPPRLNPIVCISNPSPKFCILKSPCLLRNFKISLSGQVISQDGAGVKPFELRKNGVIIGFVNITTGSSLPYTFSNKQINVNNVSVANGDTFTVTYPSYSITSLRQITSSFKVTTNSVSPVTINLGDTITINDCIPKNILQKDFFASILKLFNLYVDENRFDEKHLIIKPYVDYYNGTVEDWSDKIDRAKPIRIKPMSELNSRYYSLKYKDDNDYWNELYKKRYNPFIFQIQTIIIIWYI